MIYIDKSAIGYGKLEELRTAMNKLVEFVKANEPQLIAYNVYFDEDSAQMTVIHVHPDAESLEFHMKVAGPLFPDFAEFIKLLSIDIYGKPTDQSLQQIRQKAQMLGDGNVAVHEFQAGVIRIPGN